MEKETNRIAKVIARSGLCSRRDAERLILSGKVKVNGCIINTPALNVSEKDIVEVDSKRIEIQGQTKLYIYNKPAGIITTHKDSSGRKTVFEMLPNELGRLVSVGRLDLNSEGLLLLTNDGEFQRFMEMPQNRFERIYRVRVRGVPTRTDIQKLKSGIIVDGVRYGSIDVKVEKVQNTNSWVLIKLHEGKNREIRKTMQSLGYQVNRLIRISYAGIGIGDLKTGEVREIKIPQRILEKFKAGKE